MSSSSPPRVDYDGHQHRVYADARRHAQETRALWREAMARHVGGRTIRSVLDVGAGTSRFSGELADVCDASVFALEPSAGMRSEARRTLDHPRVAQLGGDALALPIATGCVPLVWMSMVIHHLPSLAPCVRELRRVLEPGGLAMIRSAFRDVHLESTFYGFFPAARRLDLARLPAVDEVVTCFEREGFRTERVDCLRQTVDARLADFERRMQSRPYSTFELMSEPEIDEGMRALAEATRAEPERPVYEHVHLLSFSAPGGGG